MKRAIGVFDSGIGGLTVVKELIHHLPFESIIYFGDTARAPYGTKSKSTIIRFTLENILFLLKQDVKLIVVACNTSSSIALPVIRKHFKVPIIGVILPGAKEAVYATKNKRVGVIATPGTVKSRAYEAEIKRLSPDIKVVSCACPLFVPLVEEGWLNEQATLDVAKKYLTPFKQSGVDTLILGCTHYPLLKSTIRKVLGAKINLIDSAQQVALEAKEILAGDGQLEKSCGRAKNIFFVSDEPDPFAHLAQRFLGYKLKNVRKLRDV